MDNDDPDDLIWELKLLGRPRHTHYSDKSSSVLLFKDGTNELQTHARRGEIAEEEEESGDSPDLLKWVVALAVGVSLGVGAAKVAPAVKVRWHNLMSKRSRNAASREIDSEVQAAALSTIPVDEFSMAVDVALDEHRTMSSAEAERRILETLLAAAMIAENMRALKGAHIEDGGSLELQAAMDKLTVPHLTQSLNRMLEMDNAVLDFETSALFMRFFGGGRTAEGEYVPLRHEKVVEAMRLPPPAA